MNAYTVRSREMYAEDVERLPIVFETEADAAVFASRYREGGRFEVETLTRYPEGTGPRKIRWYVIHIGVNKQGRIEDQEVEHFDRWDFEGSTFEPFHVWNSGNTRIRTCATTQEEAQRLAERAIEQIRANPPRPPAGPRAIPGANARAIGVEIQEPPHA